MSVKLILLKSGENVISDVKEMIVEEKVVGYIFEKPCCVYTRNSDDGSFQISLYPWIPITKTTNIPVPSDWVVTILEPIDELEKMYKKDVLKDD